MADTLRPETPDQVLDAIRWAAAEEQPLELVGAGTKRGWGRAIQTGHRLDLSRLSGVTLYEPEELVMTAWPGTKLTEIEAVLARQNQQLAFEPPDLGPLLGAPAGAGTAGGMFACNLAGPRRLQAGAARDHLLGLTAVSGRAESFKTGGRVVKNVTGYDLCKLMTGAFGTLGALTQVTFKVLPAPEEAETVLVRGLDDAAAVRAMTLALGGPYDVSGAAHVPAGPAARSAVGSIAAGGAATALRLEGFGPSVASRAGALREALSGLGTLDWLVGEESTAFWREVRDVTPFVGDDRTVWKLSTAPSEAAGLLAQLNRAGAEHLMDWGGGLIWLAVGAGDNAAATDIRAAIAGVGGHATLIRAPEAARAALEVFEPLPPALAALTARIKDSFDPRRILNPGRMYAGV
ncbi:MAG: glycolate oxidase subunit GlcE [Inquilinaceae bacterium]